MENENSQIGKGIRRQYSLQEKQRHLKDRASSGLSIPAYCKQQGIATRRFYYWQSQATSKVPKLRPLDLIPNKSAMVAEIEFSGGEVLRIQSGCSETMAAALAKVLA